MVLRFLARRGRKVVFRGLVTLWENKQLFMLCMKDWLPKDWFSSNMVACRSYVSGACCSVIKKKKKSSSNTSDTDLKFYIHTDSYCNNQIHAWTNANLHSIYLKIFGGSFRWRCNKVIPLSPQTISVPIWKVAFILPFAWEKLDIINLAISLWASGHAPKLPDPGWLKSLPAEWGAIAPI